MSNPIPPLLCSTPPPIDFDENNDNDDDFGAFETADAEYGGQSLAGTPEHKREKKSVNLDLPLPNDVEYPLYSNITTSVFTSIEQEENAMKAEGNIINQITKIDGIENGEKIIKTPNDESLVNNLENLETNKENINEEVLNEIKTEEEDIKTDDIPKDFLICEKNQQQQKSIKSSRENSPQSLELYSADLSEDDDESIGEFQAAVESKYDDNTSLPSLKFDPLGISKCATPIIDDKIIPNNNLDENYENLDDKSKFSAFESEYTENNQSDDCWPNTNSLNENEKDSAVDEQNIVDDNVDEFGEFNSVIVDNNLENFRQDSLEEIKNNDFNMITDQILKSEILEEEEAKFRNFEALSLPNDDEINIKSDSDILEKSSSAITNAEPLFEADFSQFETAPFETPTENIENNCNTVSVENSNEVDDEFEDFQDFTSAPIVPETEEDDEFGEFNDFIEAPTQINVPSFKAVNIDEKLKPILNLMFSLDPTNTEDNPECYKNFEKLNSTLKHLDSADALGYQWANSNVKHSLIKSLGIDSRNILYGEKWNSSMPRFAANLGFNPLEPLKPVKMNGSIITSSTSQSSNQIMESLSLSRTDVPAVEFDWNSSGLVNPLDASHAHTLLLDLDQLVVVANLDKIKLDSSSPCPSATLDLNEHHNSSIGTSGIISTTNLHRHFTSDKQFSMINSAKTTTTCDALMMMDLIDGFVNNNKQNITANCINVDVFGDGFNYANYISDTTATANFNVDSIIDNATTTTTATNYTTNFHTGFYNKTNIDPFNQYLDCRIKEILHERKTETIHTPQSCNIDQSIQQQTTTTTAAATTEASSINCETANSIPFVSIIDNDLTSTIDTDEINNDLSNSYQFDTLSKHNEIQSNTTNPSTFVVPLKETHIFTPSKTEVVVTRSTKCSSSSSGGGEKEPIDFDFKTAAAGIVIDEKVIKKEYRDIEYDPEKLSTSHLENDEFQEFQSSQQINNIEQNFETSIDRNETGWSFDLTSLDNKNDSTITKFPTINTTDMLMGDSQTQKTVETLKEFPAVISSNTSTDFFNIENDFPPISNQSVENNIGALDKKEKSLNSVVNSSFQKSDFVRNNVQKPKDNSSIDDEFSDFQSVLPPQQSSQPPKDRIKTVLVEEKTKSRTCTPTFSDEMILSPAVLLPQAIKINSSPKIEWAGPDINPQELARIEEMFAQSTKSSPKRDTQQNLSSIETFTNNDDDDWSDFVSVPAFSSFNNTQTIQSASPYKPNFCSQSESNDDEWSDFVSSVPITSNNPAQLPQSQFNSWNQTQVYNNSLGSYNQITPPNQLANNVPMSKFNHSINNNNNTISQYLIQGLAVPVESQPNHFLPHHPIPLSQINNVTSQQQQQHLHQQQQSQHHHNQQQQQQRNQNVIKSQLNRTPSISLIPDLRYVAPRNFINIPRSTTSKK